MAPLSVWLLMRLVLLLLVQLRAAAAARGRRHMLVQVALIVAYQLLQQCLCMIGHLPQHGLSRTARCWPKMLRDDAPAHESTQRRSSRARRRVLL